MRQLWIVSRDETWLYEYLHKQFTARPGVEFILDRRQGERRRAVLPMPNDRRRTERRQQSTNGELVARGVAIVVVP